MTMPVFVCPRRTPAQLFDQEFDAARQMRLLAYAAAPQPEPVQLEFRDGTFALPWKESGGSILCIGDAAGPLLHSLRRRAGLALAEAAAGKAPALPRWSSLVLLTPDLPADMFVAGTDVLSEAAFALRCFDRIIVLHCPHDRTVTGTLGRSGPAGGSDSRVSAIDLSPHIECREDSAYGALCSCEALSLILRLLHGAPLQTALPSRLRSVTA